MEKKKRKYRRWWWKWKHYLSALSWLWYCGENREKIFLINLLRAWKLWVDILVWIEWIFPSEKLTFVAIYWHKCVMIHFFSGVAGGGRERGDIMKYEYKFTKTLFTWESFQKWCFSKSQRYLYEWKSSRKFSTIWMRVSAKFSGDRRVVDQMNLWGSHVKGMRMMVI